MKGVVLFSGLCFLSLCFSQHQFIFFETPKTWQEAQSFCREKHGDLATMDDIEEIKDSLDAVQGKYSDAVWIGLKKGTTSKWHWSLATRGAYKEGESSFFKWGTIRASNCGVLQEGRLHIFSCEDERFFICFDGTKTGMEQYVVPLETMTWTSARDYCRQHHTDLTSLRNDKEYQILEELTNGTVMHVGLFRDPWVWSDQSNSSVRNWKPDQLMNIASYPNCVVILTRESGKWGTRECSETYPFLCSRVVRKLLFIQMKIEMPQTMRDLIFPPVWDRILEQMAQKLKKIVSGDFHLQLSSIKKNEVP